MSTNTNVFNVLQRQLDAELHSLSSEAKRKNHQVKQASDKSIKILKTVHSFDDLTRHPEFVVPFILACSSRNAKLTTIALQCLQGLSSMPSIPTDRLSEVLDAFTDATYLAMEIQLKVLQILPIFFKTYARHIHGKLCMKLLHCCSSLLQVPGKSPIVASTASAAMQQLIDEIFERLSHQWKNEEIEMDELKESYDVIVSNNESVKVNTYRNDANRLFADLFSLMDSSNNTLVDKSFIDVKEIPMDYGLEILEAILNNNKHVLLEYIDLQYILRTKAIPILLRCISNPKIFSITVRSCRCIQLLLRREYLQILELELEVIFGLLIHGLSVSTKSPPWLRVLALEMFNEVAQDIEMIKMLYLSYDKFPDKKHIITSLLNESLTLLKSESYIQFLGHSKVIEDLNMPSITIDCNSKTKFILLLDKAHSPPVNIGYVIWLILSMVNQWSEGLSILALNATQKTTEQNDTDDLQQVYTGLFNNLFETYKLFLYSTSFDTQLFHNLVRAFQKLTHGAGVLSLNELLKKSLDLFSSSIVNNTDNFEEKISSPTELKAADASGVLNVISESLIGPSTNLKSPSTIPSDKKALHPRTLNSKHISLFRALVSLSVSLGTRFDSECWKDIFITWQWLSYFIYGPSVDFMESYYSQDVPSPPTITKNDITTIESNFEKLFESSKLYSSSEFNILIESLIEGSRNTVIASSDNVAYHPIFGDNTKYCIYNRGFYISQLGEFASYNFGRFLKNSKGKESWKIVTDYFTSLVSDREVSNTSLRLFVVRIFTDVIKNITEEIANIDDQSERTEKFSAVEPLIMDALMETLSKLSKLGVDKHVIYSGVCSTEVEILLELLSTLKGILNEFGDCLASSWFTVFKIINIPFQFLEENGDIFKVGETEDSSLINTIIQRHTDMIQVSYDVFKLISDDFMQMLPLDIIRLVIGTLVNFVSQDRNLNISFSSISQFWLVGDYLRSRFESDIHTTKDQERVTSFINKVSEGKMMDIISSKDSESYEVYNALWIYLLRSLVECTSDKRIEVKNGAIQTFFRIIDSHSEYLPPWTLIFSVVLHPLLQNEIEVENLAEYTDFFNAAIGGLVTLYPIHFKEFTTEKLCSDAWSALLSFIQKIFSSKSTGVRYVAISNYQRLLKEMAKLSDIPEGILEQCQDLWNNYNIIYSDFSDSNAYSAKSEYDCVLELVACFPYLYSVMDKYSKVSFEFVESSLGLFTSASRYPLLPQHTKDNKRPSTLQQAILDGLTIFDSNKDREIELLVLFQLSTMSTLAFDTREKIKIKLGPKLSNAALDRIPTFEAICYKSAQMLYEKVVKVHDYELPITKEKHILKILKNLSDIIRRKSLINITSDDHKPIWLVSSQSFRVLVDSLFVPKTHSQLSESFKSDLYDLFINTLTVCIQRSERNIDEITAKDDIIEYQCYRDILIREDVIILIDEEKLKYFISTLWYTSFLYELDELEDAILKKYDSLLEVVNHLVNFDLNEIIGSIIEPPILSKNQCSRVCLEDMINFISLTGTNMRPLREITAPFLVSRIALVLRRYIADENITGRRPIPMLRRIELLTLLEGLCNIMSKNIENADLGEDGKIMESLMLLYPLILRTIPVSHKVDGIQNKVLELSLAFTKISSSNVI